MMKAAVFHTYGSPDVLKVEEIQKPVAKDNEILVKVVAASAAAGEWHMLRGEPFIMRFFVGLFTPRYKTLGAALAGRVEAVGKNVTQFRPGDEVYGDLSNAGFGAFAEYVVAPAEAFARKPANLSFEQAATAPVSAVTALQGLTRAKIQPGQKILIYGASGGVGTFAVQIAKALGAEVTAVCSTGKMEMVRALGADYVLDYTREDFTRHGDRYDLILAANGYQPIRVFQRLLKPQGIYVMSGGESKQMFEAMLLGPWLSKRGGQQLGNLLAQPNQKDLMQMTELIEAGKVKPLIDRSYPLRDVADAIRYVEAGHAKGKVVITIEPQATNERAHQPIAARQPAIQAPVHA